MTGFWAHHVGSPLFSAGLVPVPELVSASTNALCFGVPLLLSISRFLERLGIYGIAPEVQQFAPEVQRWERKTKYPFLLGFGNLSGANG